MASRRRVNRWAGLIPANCAKRPVPPRRVLSRNSPRFAGVLSTNCPPRTEAERASRAPSALPVWLDMRSRRAAAGPSRMWERDGPRSRWRTLAVRALRAPLAGSGDAHICLEAESSRAASPRPLLLRGARHANRSRLQSASELSVSATRGRVPRRWARVAPIGDTEMLTGALGPGAGLVTHRRACSRHLTATPPN